jgi:hypothetical protein
VAAPAPNASRRTLGLLGVAAFLMVVAIALGGVPAGLVVAGLGLVVLGLAAAFGAQLRWAHIASRGVGAVVAGVGVMALIAAGAALPTPAHPDSSKGTSADPSPSTTSDELAIRAAEAELAETETSESAVPEGPGSGLMTDEAAAGAAGAAATTSALAAVAALEVKGRAPRTGYDRDRYGSGWVDSDHNGCDTRNDILARDLAGETVKPGTHDCVVLTGTLSDPYSGRPIAFQRGETTSGDVQIDHVVALSDSWQKGAQDWSTTKRTSFANDPLNLLAVDGPLNMQKGDGDTATWLPPNRAYRCPYVARQVAVKVSYGLWVTQAEKNAMATVLSTCANEGLPGGVVAQVVVTPPAAEPVPAPPPPAPAPAPVPVPAPAPAPSAAYANCDAVRAAGAAPIHPGDPGWQNKFDRDGDGVGCE